MSKELHQLLPQSKSSCKNKLIQMVTSDSRNTIPGSLFFAFQGTNFDGNQFIDEAVKRGAVVIVSENQSTTELPFGVDFIQVEDVSIAYAQASAEWFNNPAQRLNIFGFTGSNGKTSCTYLLKSILECNGHPTSVIGTIGYVIGGKSITATHTTPDAFKLQELLLQSISAGDTHVVMEVSSHALALNRVYGVPFRGAVFTNLTQDHLDFHQTMESYFQAKSKLFSGKCSAEIRLVNNDNEFCRRLLQDNKILSFSIKSKQSNYIATNIRTSHNGTEFQVNGVMQGTLQIKSKLVGLYNVENILGVVALADRIGISAQVISEGISRVEGISGRMQRVPSHPDVAVFVDYAHTNDAMQKVIATARAFTKAKLRVCFGCGGNRDKTKRPLMGEAASLADCVYVTSDNPRYEEPEAIIQHILPGIIPEKLVSIEVDRIKAINNACQDLEKNDVLLILGKGSEEYMDVKGIKYPYSDFTTAMQSLESTQWSVNDS